MAKGYGFEVNDFLIAGAVLGAGYLIYKIVAKPLSDITQSAGDIAKSTARELDKSLTSTGDALSGNIDLLNIKKDVSSIFAFLNQIPPVQTGYTQEQVDAMILREDIYKTNIEITKFLNQQNIDRFIETQKLDPNSDSYTGGSSGSGGSNKDRSITGDTFLMNNYNELNTTDKNRSDFGVLPGN